MNKGEPALKERLTGQGAMEAAADRVDTALPIPVEQIDPAGVLDALDRAIWIYDPDRHRLVWGNRAALELWAAESQQAFASRPLEPLSQAARERLQDSREALDRGESVQQQWTFYPRGVARTLQCTLRHFILPNGRQGILTDGGTVADVDSEALRGLEAFRHAPVMIGLFSQDGELLQCNPAASARLGCRPGKPIGEPFVDREALGLLVAEVQAGRLWRGELRMRTVDGIRWHATEARPVHDPVTGAAAVLISQIDVTDRHETEVALRDSRDRLEEAEGLARIGSWEWEVATGRLHWSPQVFRNFGLDPGGAEPSLEDYKDWIHPDDRPIVERMIDHALNHGGAYNIEHRVNRPDGSIGWIAARARVERDVVGCPVRMFGIAQDITDQKKAQIALRHSEERFRQVVEAAGEYIWETDLDARFTFVTDRASTTLGRPLDEIIGRQPFDFMPPDEAERMRRMFFEEVLPNRKSFSREDYRSLRPDGTVIWQRVSGVPFYGPDGKLEGYRGTVLDITEQRQLADRLREMRRAELTRVKAAVDGATEAIAIADADGRTVYVNRALTQLFGLTPEELDARGGVASLVGAPAEAHDWTGETTLETAEGRQWEVAVRLSPIRGEGAVPLGRMAMLTDVTEIKRTERQRRQLEQQFFQAQKLEAVGRLAGGIAHDFNNILAAIIGYDTFLVDDLPEGSEQRRYAEQIGLAAERAKGLVRRLLAFSRRSEDESTVVDVAQLVDETAEMLRATLPSSIELSVAVARRPLSVRGNPTQLSQVLMNLGVNARDAIGDRHGTIRLTLDAAEADAPSTDSGHDARLSLGTVAPGTPVARLRISDDGCGMTREVMERIFEPFFTTKVTGDGTGLGLAAVHGIVEAHQGSLVVDSTAQRGTVFDIRLPLTLADAAPAVPRSTAPCGGAGATILVIDDEEMVTTMTARLLERSGYDVVATTDPTEALESLLGDPDVFDCVVTDQTMPELTGIELIEALAREGVHVPVILLSGNLTGIEDRAREAGAAAVLRKPVERSDLIGAIDAALVQHPVAAAKG